MKSIIEYIKDVRWWASHYPQGWWKDKKRRKIYIRNAIYCVAPARWKAYNRMLHIVFDN